MQIETTGNITGVLPYTPTCMLETTRASALTMLSTTFVFLGCLERQS